MDLDSTVNTSVDESSSEECIILLENSPSGVSSTAPDSPMATTPTTRLSKVDSTQRKSEQDSKRAENEALKLEKLRLKEELKAKKAAELQQEKTRRAEEKARKAEELQQEKARKAEELLQEKARKAEELQQEKARKAEELLQEKARKAEELQQEKARKAEEKARRAEELQQEKVRKAEEKARKEAEIASKKAELIQKKEQKQAAVQKKEFVNKQMATYMDKFFKPIEKTTQKDYQTATTNANVVIQRCTDDFDQLVSKQNVSFVSDIIENIKSLKKIDIESIARPRLNSDSNSCTIIITTATPTTTTANSSYLLKTRYIHFPEKYFNRPPYYGTFKKALASNVNPLQPNLPIDKVDYAVDSEDEWEEPCKDGEDIRSDADDLSDSEAIDDDSDTDSFIVPHGHLSDDELNEDEQQQSTSTKQAREAAKSHMWDKKVARLNQQRELKPLFGCIYDPALDEKVKFELSNYLHQFQRIMVPKEICIRPEQDDKDQEVTDETTTKDEKAKKPPRKKSLLSKKGAATEQQQPMMINPTTTTPTATVKRTGSVSNIVDGASPSKRRKVNSNENCSIVDDSDVMMTDIDAVNTSKTNVLEDASNVSDIKLAPLAVISNDEVKFDSTPICTLLIPKRKHPPA